MAGDSATFDWASIVSSLIIAIPSTFAAIAAWRSAKNTLDVLKLQRKKVRQAELDEKIRSVAQETVTDLWTKLKNQDRSAP